jgi:hypothetical protein
MTRDDIIRMAREAGWDDHHCQFDTRIERFASLVAAAERERVMNEPINKEHWQRFEDEIRAAEREACLEIADRCADADMHASMAANAIRARGQA